MPALRIASAARRTVAVTIRWRNGSHSRLILAGLRVDADLVAFVDERRHLDDQARFERGGLHLRTRRRSLDARHGLLDDQINRLGQLDSYRFRVVELD